MSGSDPRAPLAITLDGRALAPDAPALPVTERGYAYGDGLFETIPVAQRPRLRARRAHLARLVASARALGLPVPDATVLERAIEATLHDAGPRRRRRARDLVARRRRPRLRPAAAGRGRRAPAGRRGVPGAPAAGGEEACASRACAASRRASSSVHKTLSAIHYVVAADRARAAGADDALLVDARGRVLETTGRQRVRRDGRPRRHAAGGARAVSRHRARPRDRRGGRGRAGVRPHRRCRAPTRRSRSAPCAAWFRSWPSTAARSARASRGR